MRHTYTVTGMHCENCIQKVEKAIRNIPDVENVEVSLEPPGATISMKKHIETEVFNAALKDVGTYGLIGNDMMESRTSPQSHIPEEKQISIQDYYPLILVFAYLLSLVGIKQFANGFSFSTMMSDFMGGFFITFSFFKLLDLRGFAASYSLYDIITKRWIGFGYIYPFIELAFGVGFLFFPGIIGLYLASLIVMSISIIGVLQSVLHKRKIQCACLGTVFNLPMGTITIIEDGLMITMSAIMLLMKLHHPFSDL